jgi:cytochrome c oxidase assembly protein subunit 15
MGRLLGLLFAVPLLYFAVRRAIPRGYMGRLVLLLLLGGAQGGIGWLMVKSGLTNRINVQPAMLAAHLSMALLLMSMVLWTALDIIALHRNPHAQRARLTWGGAVPFLLLFVQIFLAMYRAHGR